MPTNNTVSSKSQTERNSHNPLQDPTRRQWTSVHDQYKTLEILGQGTYGVVYKAEHKVTGEIVAMKRCRLDSFREFGIPETTLREIALLRDLRHENIMTLYRISCNTERMYMICEYLDLDLKKYIRANPKGLSLQKIKSITYELFKGLAFCHGHRVLHRDLKPHNVLVSADATKVKIADFGLARSALPPGKTLTHEVITLWYRAPELLLGHCNYTTGVDIWSLGCIVAELLSSRPLYIGDSEIDTLFKIFRLLGTPEKEEWPEHAVTGWSDFPRYEGKSDPFGNLSAELDDDGKDFLKRIFQFDPLKRPSALEALNHRWLAEIRTKHQSDFKHYVPEWKDWVSNISEASTVPSILLDSVDVVSTSCTNDVDHNNKTKGTATASLKEVLQDNPTHMIKSSMTAAIITTASNDEQQQPSQQQQQERTCVLPLTSFLSEEHKSNEIGLFRNNEVKLEQVINNNAINAADDSMVITKKIIKKYEGEDPRIANQQQYDYQNQHSDQVRQRQKTEQREKKKDDNKILKQHENSHNKLMVNESKAFQQHSNHDDNSSGIRCTVDTLNPPKPMIAMALSQQVTDMHRNGLQEDQGVMSSSDSNNPETLPHLLKNINSTRYFEITGRMRQLEAQLQQAENRRLQMIQHVPQTLDAFSVNNLVAQKDCAARDHNSSVLGKLVVPTKQPIDNNAAAYHQTLNNNNSDIILQDRIYYQAPLKTNPYTKQVVYNSKWGSIGAKSNLRKSSNNNARLKNLATKFTEQEQLKNNNNASKDYCQNGCNNIGCSTRGQNLGNEEKNVGISTFTNSKNVIVGPAPALALNTKIDNKRNYYSNATDAKGIHQNNVDVAQNNSKPLAKNSNNMLNDDTSSTTLFQGLSKDVEWLGKLRKYPFGTLMDRKRKKNTASNHSNPYCQHQKLSVVASSEAITALAAPHARNYNVNSSSDHALQLCSKQQYPQKHHDNNYVEPRYYQPSSCNGNILKAGSTSDSNNKKSWNYNHQQRRPSLPSISQTASSLSAGVIPYEGMNHLTSFVDNSSKSIEDTWRSAISSSSSLSSSLRSHKPQIKISVDGGPYSDHHDEPTYIKAERRIDYGQRRSSAPEHYINNTTYGSENIYLSQPYHRANDDHSLPCKEQQQQNTNGQLFIPAATANNRAATTYQHHHCDKNRCNIYGPMYNGLHSTRSDRSSNQSHYSYESHNGKISHIESDGRLTTKRILLPSSSSSSSLQQRHSRRLAASSSSSSLCHYDTTHHIKHLPQSEKATRSLVGSNNLKDQYYYCQLYNKNDIENHYSSERNYNGLQRQMTWGINGSRTRYQSSNHLKRQPLDIEETHCLNNSYIKTMMTGEVDFHTARKSHYNQHELQYDQNYRNNNDSNTEETSAPHRTIIVKRRPIFQAAIHQGRSIYDDGCLVRWKSISSYDGDSNYSNSCDSLVKRDNNTTSDTTNSYYIDKNRNTYVSSARCFAPTNISSQCDKNCNNNNDDHYYNKKQHLISSTTFSTNVGRTPILEDTSSSGVHPFKANKKHNPTSVYVNPSGLGIPASWCRRPTTNATTAPFFLNDNKQSKVFSSSILSNLDEELLTTKDNYSTVHYYKHPLSSRTNYVIKPEGDFIIPLTSSSDRH